MTFYIRKAISVGPLRFNLSKSGIGVSVGIPGFRVGSGAKGNYIHAGRHGIYYRKTLPGEPIESSTAFRDIAEGFSAGPSKPLGHGPEAPPPKLISEQRYESGSTLSMSDAGSEQLLNDLNEKRNWSASWPYLLGLLVVGVITLAILGAPAWACFVAGAASLATCFWRYERDELDRYVVSMYDLEDSAAGMFRELCETFEVILVPGAVWHVEVERDVDDVKRTSGASTAVDRKPISPRIGEGPPHLKTNIPIPSLPVGTQTLYFLPDRILVAAPEGYGSVKYSDLEVRVKEERFVESRTLLPGSKVIDTAWKYSNKSGGPDRRFKDNVELPVVMYNRLLLRSKSGLNESLQFTLPTTAERFQTALAGLA